MLLSQALQKLLAIVTSMGLMRRKTLPFGPKNAPPEFQAAVNEIFRDLIPKYLRIFVDDLLARTGRAEEGGGRGPLERSRWGK